MKTLQKNLIGIVVLAVLALIIGYVVHAPAPKSAPDSQGQPIATVSYSCDGGKSIEASLFQGASQPAPAPGEPPVPTGSAQIILSDGRNMTLQQTISADGVRYANADESFVFWTKGNGAFVMEGNDQTYANCVEAQPQANSGV